MTQTKLAVLGDSGTVDSAEVPTVSSFVPVRPLPFRVEPQQFCVEAAGDGLERRRSVVKFAAVHRDFMNQPPALTASCAAIGAWMRILVYASDKETDVLVGANDWIARAWLISCGIDKEELYAVTDAGLAKWVNDGRDLLVLGFDHDGLRAIQAKRANGALGGRPKTTPEPIGSPQDNLDETPLLSSSSLSPPPPSDQELPAPRSRGAKSYPVAFANLWSAISHVGGIGNSNKYEAYSAWLAVGKPMDGVANCWGEYIGSLPPYQDTAKHVGRWLKARGHEQSYVPHQPANARPSATGAATKPIEAPRCPPHRDRVIPPTKMGERWASPGMPCCTCKELSAKWGDRHVDEDDLFARAK